MNEHPYDVIRNHINEEEWKYLLKLRRYISRMQDVDTMGRGVLSDEQILKDLIEGYWLS